MKTKKQNTNQYDKNRKARDAWYKASKNGRSLLSIAVRKYINSGGVIPKSPTLEALLGCPLSLFLPRLVLQANKAGFNLFTDYGTICEIDHLTPVSVYQAQASWNLRETLEQCFNYRNLAVASVKDNRNHNLKPTSKIRMGRRAA